MDISSYNSNGHNERDIKMDKHQELPIGPTNIESLDLGVGSRLEYWTTPKMVETNKNARIDLCGSIIYGDAIDHMMLPKDGPIHGDVRSWRDLTGASRTNSVTKLPFPALALSERLGQTRPIEEKEVYYIKKLKVGGDGTEDEDGIIADRQGWEEAATSQGEDHHPQYNVQKEELRNNSCQMDRSIEHRLQSNRNLEDSNMLGIDIRRRSRQDIHELDTVLERSKGTRDNITYGECQKNQSADRGMTSVDGCGQFLSSDKDGKLAFICAACGCHRNFHQRILIFEGEEQQELVKAKNEKEEGGDNYFTPICDIDRVAHELISAANGAIALAQDSLCYNEGRNQDLSIEEQNIIAKISLENLDHITKVINSTTECLILLRKSSSSEKDRKLDCPHEGPSSSDASPVITVEKRATQSLLTPTSPARPFPVVGGPPLKNSITLFSDACGMHNCGSAPRKPLERPSQKLKRTRTRISLEQREKLNAFAEKAGWTVVGQRKETIDAACQYIGIEPKTLKYWIHNSKQKWKRQPGQSDDMSKL
ncbi:hypothetical protein M758_3G167800 [Ceratodon purpureus]|nr:hypothetical protein M758_3G167800 [Ceratodon purpureus]